jgi:hypothetical protein
VQVVKGKRNLLNPNLICIFVLLIGRGKDEFYVFRLRTWKSIARRFTSHEVSRQRSQTRGTAWYRARNFFCSRKTERSWRLPCGRQTSSKETKTNAPSTRSTERPNSVGALLRARGDRYFCRGVIMHGQQQRPRSRCISASPQGSRVVSTEVAASGRRASPFSAAP